MIRTIKQHSNPNGLRTTRKRLGLTQQQLAEELQVSRSTIEHAENNIRSLPTSALLKLAMLEMKGQDSAVNSTDTEQKPAEHYTVSKGRNTCSMMLIQEAACRIKSRKLCISLNNMIAEHERVSKWMRMAEALHENALLKRQKESAIKKLAKCGIPAQGLLRHEISLLDGQAELYSSMQRHVHNELNAHFGGQ